MSNVIALKPRAREEWTDVKLVPSAGARDEYGHLSPSDILHACGYIPAMFMQAVESLHEDGAPVTVDAVAARLDIEYGWNVWGSPAFKGHIRGDGAYASPYDDDPDLQPFMRLIAGPVVCYIYPYGITALREGLAGPYRITRMD